MIASLQYYGQKNGNQAKGGEQGIPEYRSWTEIRGAVNRGPARRRRVEAARREAEDEQAFPQ